MTGLFYGEEIIKRVRAEGSSKNPGAKTSADNREGDALWVARVTALARKSNRAKRIGRRNTGTLSAAFGGGLTDGVDAKL